MYKALKIIVQELNALGRPNLYRTPLLAFSRADDEGYTRLKQIIGPWHQTPDELLPGAKSVISYFVPFTRQVADQPKDYLDGAPLWGEAYVVINAYFDQINKALSDYFAEQGFLSVSIKSTHTYDPADMKSAWSHRHAAVISGLGVFGVNRMLLTAKGSVGRIGTLLTTADCTGWEPQARYMGPACPDCGLCIKACPVNALSAERFDKFACQDELNKNDANQRATTGYTADVCGKCISACPLAYIE